MAANRENLEDYHKTAMEAAVKRIYEINRKTLVDAGKICADHKATYDRTLEKYKKLQLHTEAVNSENKRLRGLIDDNMRGGDCCASLRQALATLNSSYKQLLNEKDERIRILEEKLKKNRKESASEVDSMLVSPEKKIHDRATLQSTATADSARSVGVNKSPDSTSHTTPQKIDPLRTCGRDEAFCNVPPGGADEDVVADSPEKSPNSSARLRLQKTRGKRSRYTEEDAPESKKARQISPKAAPPTTATAERRSKKSKKETSTVLVPDTCFHGLDESFQLNTKSKPPDKYVPGHKSRQDKGKQSRRNTSVSGKNYDNLQTIPETLDMFAEFDEESDVEDSQDAGESQGWTVDNAVKKTNGQGNENLLCKNHKGILNTHLAGNQETMGNPHKKTEVPGEEDMQRSVLDSPQSDMLSDRDVTIQEAINHRTLDLSTFVCSDEETNAVVDKEGNCDVSAATLSKSLDTDSSSQSLAIKHTSPTFPNQRAEQIKQRDCQPVLRRSPRRHKYRERSDASRHENLTSNVSTKRTLQLENGKDNNRNTKPVNKKTDAFQQEVANKNDASSAAHCGLSDFDVTVAPDDETATTIIEPEVNCRHNSDSAPNKVFQVKGVKNKSDKIPGNDHQIIQDDSNSRRKDRNPLTDPDIFVTDMQSPSLLVNKKASHVSESDVIAIGSQSVGSVSDVESPLLLQRTKKSTESSTDWITSKSRKSNLRSSQHNETALSKSLKKASGKTKTADKGKVFHFEFEAASCAKNNSKNLRQTTLTQRFFASPEKNKSSGNDVHSLDSDSDIQEAIRLSLGEIQGSQDSQNDDDIDVLFNESKENSPPFKRPRLPKKCAKSSKSLSRKHNEEFETVDLDETVQPHPTRPLDMASVLHELKSQRINTHHDELQLNGSLDPAVELTEYVSAGETIDGGHGLNTVASLPSIDIGSMSAWSHQDIREELQVRPCYTLTVLLDLCTADLHGRKTSTQADDDSQIPSSSRSYTFGPRKKIKKKYQDTQDIVESQGNIDLDDSFDRLPKKTAPEFAHVTVVRKRDERQKLIGHSCKECYDYYKSKGLPEEDIQRQIQKCSRHRAKHLPPDTPPHFWSIGFIDTQECVDRGYIQLEDPDEKDAAPSYRRRRRLEKRFKSKNETATCDADIDD